MTEARDRDSALSEGVRLETFTVGWMGIEATVALAAGIVAGSIVLTAFGADSLVELLSGGVLLWRLRVEVAGGEGGTLHRVEGRATRIAAVLLTVLVLLVAVTSVLGLALRVEPRRSWFGVAVSAIALVVMASLAARKRAINRTLQSPALRADIAQSVTCAYLAGVALVGTAANAITGLWWVEDLAAMALLIWLVPEAREAVEAARALRGR